jgi:hypothetical protein
MTQNPLTAYTVRSVKTFTGMEGPGFNAMLCRDGKPVAFVIDDANGGCLHFQWNSRAEEMALEAACKQMPPTDFEGMSIAYNPDMLLSRLVDRHENDKRLKRIARKKTLFRVKGDDPEEWRTLNVVGEKAAQYLARKYGEQIEAIYGLAP